MINPLDSTETFYMEIMNPNPTSSKTKDGPKYRVSFEVDRNTWDCFMDAETAGLVIEAACQVTHRNSEPMPKAKRDPNTIDFIEGAADKELKGGPLSIRSEKLVMDPDFLRFCCKHDKDSDNQPGELYTDEDAREYIRERCHVTSRKYLDHNDRAEQEFHKLLSEYTRWQNA